MMAAIFAQNVIIILFCTLVVTLSAVIKSVTLTTSNPIIDGANISCIHNDCNVNQNEWQLDSTNELGFHLKINLDTSWGFHPTKPSTISLTASGSTPLNGEKGAPKDLDPLFVFSVNNAKYITFWSAFDEGWFNAIYPATGYEQVCEAFAVSTPITVLGQGDIEQIVALEQPYPSVLPPENDPDVDLSRRGSKATGGYRYGHMAPARDPPDNSWPTTFTVTNDPVHNQTRVQMMNSNSAWTQGCSYGESFPTNGGLQIYLAVDETGEHIEFSQFEMTYEYATAMPTKDPSSSPTQVPTYSPTPPPTTVTAYPTQMTKLPIQSPSNPTRNPTKIPTLFVNDPLLNARVPTGFPTKRTLEWDGNILSTQQTQHNDSEKRDNASTVYTIVVIVTVSICCVLLLVYVARIRRKQRVNSHDDNATMAELHKDDEQSAKEINVKPDALESANSIVNDPSRPTNRNGQMNGEGNMNDIMDDIELEATTKGEQEQYMIEPDEFVIQGDDETIM
eukprot:503738_1